MKEREEHELKEHLRRRKPLHSRRGQPHRWQSPPWQQQQVEEVAMVAAMVGVMEQQQPPPWQQRQHCTRQQRQWRHLRLHALAAARLSLLLSLLMLLLTWLLLLHRACTKDSLAV